MRKINLKGLDVIAVGLDFEEGFVEGEAWAEGGKEHEGKKTKERDVFCWSD